MQQVAIAQGLSPVLLSSQQSGEDVVTSIWEALTARGCVMCPPPNQPPQRALLCSVSAPNLLQAQEPKAKHVGAAGYNQYLFSRTESWNPRTGQAGRDHRGSPGATSLLSQGHPRAHTGLQPDSSGISPARETPHPQLCQTTAALSITLLSFGVTIKGKEGSLRET